MIESPGLFNYWAAIVLMMVGFYVVIAHNNLVKKLIGLGLFQTSVFIFYIAIGKVSDASPPIQEAGIDLYSNPLPHVLILTAIVVGVATAAVGLGLIVRIREAYGTIEDDQINRMDREADNNE
jgi:multicomponent Na+:H+ antiporter subunit C